MDSIQKESFTPMMQQYLEIKEDYADAIVFFRLGDFYEMFFDDALLASKVLEIALTSRDAGKKVPMCGVPYHAAPVYLQKLIEKGFKVAIAEQTSQPGKGLVKREVIRLITPGTIIEDNILEQDKNNFIASILLTEHGYALTYVDISTGEAYLTDELTMDLAFDLIQTLSIKEIVIPSYMDQKTIMRLSNQHILVTHANQFDLVERKYIQHLSKDQKRAASHLLNYLEQTQKQSIHHLQSFKIIKQVGHMQVDYKVKKHLEIDTPLSGNPKSTLLHWLDETQTAMGSRRLKSFLNHPLTDKALLNKRFDFIQSLSNYRYQQDLIEALRYIYDINRIVSRVSFQTANAKDLIQLKTSLEQVPQLKAVLYAFQNELLSDYAKTLDEHQDLHRLLSDSLVEDPPLSIKEGGIIKEGYHADLDALRDIDHLGQSWLETFEEQERQKTGIKNLKIGFNRVFGYYIEVSKGNQSLVKDEFGYERKQTLANSERYITPDLKEKEDNLLHAKEKAITLEYELFKAIREQVYQYVFSLQGLSTLIADLDVYLSFSIVARNYQLVRPEFSKTKDVRVLKGRHLMVERFGPFVANDIIMKPGEIFLITGPNMSGKSTYMRMYALIIYLAQIGSFVPAESAQMPIYDALFTRIGSSDDLSGGKSTFMVEMVESNEALTKATDQSLILFDEIGRGTATYDGMALAQGIIEYIHEKIGAQTFFSTHYHELTALESSLKRLTNLSVIAKEENHKMIFLHQVQKGASDRSYGLQVAALANLPQSLLTRSKQILKHLEKHQKKTDLDLFNFDQIENQPVIRVDTTTEELIKQLEAVDLNQITPLDALLLLKHYQELLKKK